VRGGSPGPRPAVRFERRLLDELSIGDERSFRHVALYADLKGLLRASAYRFRLLPRSSPPRADRALLLNLTFWHPASGGDVLGDDRIEADVVAHVAWHHLAARALAGRAGAPLLVDALLLGESIASAFDLYLVGRLLGHAPRSTFLATQVPAMAAAAAAAGLPAPGFARLLDAAAADPERAFADLRELLYDAARALVAAADAEKALRALARFDRHRFSSLLHHYELSNWVLYARAYGSAGERDARASEVDAALRAAAVPLDWLTANWIAPNRKRTRVAR